VAARLWAASGLVWSAASCGADDAEPCCPALLQYLGGRGLLLQRFARLVDEPRVLHPDRP